MTIFEFINNLSDERNMESIIKETYIPVEDKRNIALEVLEACTSESEGYVQIDRFKRDIYFTMAMLREYTTLKLSYDYESMVEEYDVLYENNVPTIVFNYIGDDYKRAKRILSYEEQNILNKNSIEAQVAKVSFAAVNMLHNINGKLENFNVNDLFPAGTDVNKTLEMLNKFVRS